MGAESLAVAGILTVILLAVIRVWRARSPKTKPPAPAAVPQSRSRTTVLYEILHTLYPVYEEAARPADLSQHPNFERGVQLLLQDGEDVPELLQYLRGDNLVLACLAMEALSRGRQPLDVADEIVSVMDSVAPWSRAFALRALAARTPPDRSVVGPLLLRLDQAWTNRFLMPVLREFVAHRLRAGEPVAFGPDLRKLPEERIELLRGLLDDIGAPGLEPLRRELDDWLRNRIDTKFLGGLGRIWTAESASEADQAIEHEELLRHVQALERTLSQQPARSMLIVGEAGVGKTAIVRALASRLQKNGWLVFEAGETELIAGQIYIGQLEERVLQLVRRLEGRERVLWYVPDFHRLAWTGRTLHHPLSALDSLLPHIEQGRLLILGETQPAAYERLIVEKPRCVTVLEAHRVEPLAASATLDLARAWALRHGTTGVSILSEPNLREAWQLAQQYLGDLAAPGNLLKLLDLTWQRLGSDGLAVSAEIRDSDLYFTLSKLTGLPESLLDERHSLSLADLRQLFAQRVLGQPEAVDCLVERVAMIKAGVTDPTRPLGVFLFAGPTGTGKTEIAKTLAEFLFGSSNRLIRIDMSELKTPDSLARLLGSEDRRDTALVDLVRKQPFSVVLLDEFEKAHPAVWDVFLQVFDDGRLTDRAGNTADFRHAIIIMTSNLGGVIASGTTLGFIRHGEGFRADVVEKAITTAFSPELLNRIDRIVVFRPLGRDTMREILRKQLDAAIQRRGLRNRSWAIEWSDDAVEFLLAKGFSATLGARPLQRAVERYVLTPLAVTIVDHQFPEGDQFLLVRAEGDALKVEFVDLSASVDSVPGVPPLGVERAATPIRLERIAFDPHGSASEVDCLESSYARLHALVESSEWQAVKASLLGRMASSDFWHSEARFEILGDAEQRDRIEAGLRGAGSLLERLSRSGRDTRASYPRDLIGRLAQQLYLLDTACTAVQQVIPHDAFLSIEGVRDRHDNLEASAEFAARLARMYGSWANRRRMQLEVVNETAASGNRPYRFLAAISGFGAYAILRHEDGLHVFEVPAREGGTFAHLKARVRVVPQPHMPAGSDPGALERQARKTLDGNPAGRLTVVRRYRERPAPWVRDRVRGWRTGKLERVLAGDFDLLTSVEP